MRFVPPGAWMLVITVDGLPQKRVWVTQVGDQATNAGAIRVTRPGAIQGRIYLEDDALLDMAVVAIPPLGLFVRPDATGIWLLPEVPEGQWAVALLLPGVPATARPALVQRHALTTSVDFDLRQGDTLDPVDVPDDLWLPAP